MSSNAGYLQMGAQPVAGRVRAMHACVSGRSMVAAGSLASAAASHASWLAGFEAKPATTTRIAVPDANGTRRSRGTP